MWFNQRARKLAWPLREPPPPPPRALPMTGVMSVLLVYHRAGLSLENVILKIRSRVNNRHSLWGKLLSSMIRLCLNVTIYIHVHLVMGMPCIPVNSMWWPCPTPFCEKSPFVVFTGQLYGKVLWLCHIKANALWVLMCSWTSVYIRISLLPGRDLVVYYCLFSTKISLKQKQSSEISALFHCIPKIICYKYTSNE